MHPMSETESLNIPNLDAMDAEDLGSFAALMRDLADYADTKRCAAKHRLAGNIRNAVDLENCAESIYARLPDEARW